MLGKSAKNKNKSTDGGRRSSRARRSITVEQLEKRTDAAQWMVARQQSDGRAEAGGGADVAAAAVQTRHAAARGNPETASNTQLSHSLSLSLIAIKAPNWSGTSSETGSLTASSFKAGDNRCAAERAHGDR